MVFKQTLADGELLQLGNTHSTIFSEEAYYEVITKKTAVLFSTCGYIGALLGGADSERVQTLERFGHLVGLCFQLRDDIFDFDETLNVGKPKGNDLQEGKLTLPVIHALNSTTNARYHHLAMRVRSHEASRLEIQELVDFTLKSGGIGYAESEMARLHDEALALLDRLHDKEVAKALALYLDYAVNRQH